MENQDHFKKLLSTGLSFISLSASNTENLINELVAKGRISDDEGKKIIESFQKESEETKQDFQEEFKKFNDTLFDRMDIARKSEVNELRKRIELLEMKSGRSS